MKFHYLIVGAGLAGCTLAERLANESDRKVLLVEKRDHIGGHCTDRYNDDGILVQIYGPHIFHTRIQRVWEYLNRFTSFNTYIHRVLSAVREGLNVYFPLNLETMEKITGRSFSPESLNAYFEEKRVKIDEKDIKNSRDVVISQVGEELYELFIKNYSKKQWGLYPEELDPQVLRRIPVRYNRDTRYFDDPWQGIPSHGYFRIFENMVKHKNIHILLQTDYKEVISQISFDRMIYTGPIDYFFDYVYGRLPYRTMVFNFQTLDMEYFQEAAVVNYPNFNNYTRITEFKHFYLQQHPRTTICYEYSTGEGEPYYPIPTSESRIIYEKYKAEAAKLKNTYFVGRLAEYRYINMDQAVNSALELFHKLQSPS